MFLGVVCWWCILGILCRLEHYAPTRSLQVEIALWQLWPRSFICHLVWVADAGVPLVHAEACVSWLWGTRLRAFEQQHCHLAPCSTPTTGASGTGLHIRLPWQQHYKLVVQSQRVCPDLGKCWPLLGLPQSRQIDMDISRAGERANGHFV